MSATERSRTGATRFAFGVAMALLVLGVLELGLFLTAAVSPRVALLLSTGIPLAIPDAVLGERPNPAVPDHDAAGWRNAERPERVRVVAIGDSQTYGHIVARDEAWPQRLQARGGVTVYNMGLGGYGPVEYLLVLEEALRLGPELVLVGLYSGNDLFGSYAAVYGEGREPSLRWEERFWERARSVLDAQGIRSVDTLPALRVALAGGESPYPADWNGHLNAFGNDVVAAAVAGSAPLRELTSKPTATQAGGRTSDP